MDTLRLIGYGFWLVILAIAVFKAPIGSDRGLSPLVVVARRMFIIGGRFIKYTVVIMLAVIVSLPLLLPVLASFGYSMEIRFIDY